MTIDNSKDVAPCCSEEGLSGLFTLQQYGLLKNSVVLQLNYKPRCFLQLILFWWVLKGGCVPVGSLCWRQARGRIWAPWRDGHTLKWVCWLDL